MQRAGPLPPSLGLVSRPTPAQDDHHPPPGEPALAVACGKAPPCLQTATLPPLGPVQAVQQVQAQAQARLPRSGQPRRQLTAVPRTLSCRAFSPEGLDSIAQLEWAGIGFIVCAVRVLRLDRLEIDRWEEKIFWDEAKDLIEQGAA